MHLCSMLQAIMVPTAKPLYTLTGLPEKERKKREKGRRREKNRIKGLGFVSKVYNKRVTIRLCM